MARGKQFDAIQLAITYSQCPVPKAEAALQLNKALAPVKELVIVQERHKDGNHHLHAYVHCGKRYKSSGSHVKLELHFGDPPQRYYPDVQGV